jgi:hypothetical protein
MGSWQPDISESFYDSSIFKLLPLASCADTSCRATWNLKIASDLKSHLMPLHFVTILRGVSKLQFPSGGLSWELFVQLLTNIISLFHLAMRDYSLATMHTIQVPFLVNLDTVFHLVSSNEVCLSWPVAPRNYMVAAYMLLKSLFLLYTHSFYCLESTIPGAEIVDASRPASTKI